MGTPIITKVFGPGNVRGARVKASAGNKFSVMIGYPHELSGEHVHRRAVAALLAKIENHCIKTYGAETGKAISDNWRGEHVSTYLTNDTMVHIKLDRFTEYWTV
jgi:hypothetical protein